MQNFVVPEKAQMELETAVSRKTIAQSPAPRRAKTLQRDQRFTMRQKAKEL
jgi:hypothetical protein